MKQWAIDKRIYIKVFNFLESIGGLRNLAIIFKLRNKLNVSYLYEGLKKLSNLASLDISDWSAIRGDFQYVWIP